MTVKAIYEDGAFKPKEPVSLEDHSEVELEIRSAAPTAPREDDDPTGWKAIDELIGCIKDAPADVSENHDRYLYGDPTR